jgi:hypothetical protein
MVAPASCAEADVSSFARSIVNVVEVIAVTEIFSSFEVPGLNTAKNGNVVGQPVTDPTVTEVAELEILELMVVVTGAPLYPLRTGKAITIS